MNTSDKIKVESSFTFSLKSWVKIWFSEDSNVGLPIINKKRLEDLFKLNPDIQVNLIYSSKLLNTKGIADLNDFSSKHSNLIIIDFNSEEFKAFNTTENQKRLYKIAEKELDNLSKGGVSAAASDIVRLLPGSYMRGIYTDFDVYIGKIEPQTDSFSTSKSILYSQQNKTRCNDVVAISLCDESEETLKAVYKNIFNNYRKFSLFAINISLIENLKDNTSLLFLYLNKIDSLVKGTHNYLELDDVDYLKNAKILANSFNPSEYKSINEENLLFTIRQRLLFFIHHLNYGSDLDNKSIIEQIKDALFCMFIKYVTKVSGPGVLPRDDYTYEKTFLGSILVSQQSGQLDSADYDLYPKRNDSSWVRATKR